MTIRDAVLRVLSRGSVPENPDELVEIAIVPIAVGPMTLGTLRTAGFHASGAPTFNIVTDVASDYRVLVPRHEAVTATKHLHEIL
jgi:hypothetical protein